MRQAWHVFHSSPFDIIAQTFCGIMLLTLRSGKYRIHFSIFGLSPFIVLISIAFSVIEMNTAIMVSCATSLPSFFLKTKVYLQLTTSSIRSRITGFVESRSASRKPSRERLGDNSDHFTELRDLVPPVKPDRVYTHPAPKLSPSPSIRA